MTHVQHWLQHQPLNHPLSMSSINAPMVGNATTHQQALARIVHPRPASPLLGHPPARSHGERSCSNHIQEEARPLLLQLENSLITEHPCDEDVVVAFPQGQPGQGSVLGQGSQASVTYSSQRQV
eukprot:CAMPEP_0119116652 /NCGR_PEP_ID=MMETSP1180-20130426/52408_1 /TAXON_ID=3052 ORGANISM="Chlamydomonas cf sp, Strain CCMP681" /NCGR_SAMPLE_ID=MMETSP1180 /ASSEMBLY_ACC=CAM_ASM_000741 /LENGTH=123 /DNA_ID=CAMNT_0007105827 /DNA_START=90 /DNA_END=461 /DNA_ORIENTATION=+